MVREFQFRPREIRLRALHQGKFFVALYTGGLVMAAKEGCSDWKAWHDSEPGSEPTLHVTGKCHFQDAGYSVELRPHVPQGINPTIYIMDKIVHKPDHVSHHPSDVGVDYKERTKARYVGIHILPDDVHVPVKEVSAEAEVDKISDSAQSSDPVLLTGIVSKLGIDYCMDGATHALQTLAGPARLKAESSEVLTFLNRVSGTRLRVTVVGYPVWGPECAHVAVYYAAPSQEVAEKLHVQLRR